MNLRELQKKLIKDIDIKYYASILFYEDAEIDSCKDKIETKEINSSYVFVALNPSKGIGLDFMSFHSKHVGSSDYVLKELSTNPKFKNCYITDLIKVDINGKRYETPKGLTVEKDVLDNKKLYEINRNILNKEIALLGNPTVVYFGDSVKRIVNYYSENPIFVSHYSMNGSYKDKAKLIKKQIEKNY